MDGAWDPIFILKMEKNMKRQLAFPKQNRLLARKIKSKEKIHNLFSFLRDSANGNASAFNLLMSKWLHSLLIKTASITKQKQPGEPRTSWWTQTPSPGKNARPKRNSRITSSFWLTGHAEGRKTYYNSTGKSIRRMTQCLQQIREKGKKEKEVQEGGSYEIFYSDTVCVWILVGLHSKHTTLKSKL